MPDDSLVVRCFTTIISTGSIWNILTLCIFIWLFWVFSTKRKAVAHSMQDKKDLYRTKRDDFVNEDGNLKELRIWKEDSKQFPDYDYTKLKGLISKDRLKAQTPQSNGTSPKLFKNSDSYFSEFATHNDTALILSPYPYDPKEHVESYIIGNSASYDKRQYPTWLDPKYKECTPEGQGFGHCLVIPKKRIYNIVDPEATANNCAIIKELKDHFVKFWQTEDGRARLLERTKANFDAQNDKLLGKDPERAEEVIRDVTNGYKELEKNFLKLSIDDFMYAFHPAPLISVGHLHMHVFPAAEVFRANSAKKHDWKTIPFDAIVQVEQEDKAKGKELRKG